MSVCELNRRTYFLRFSGNCHVDTELIFIILARGPNAARVLAKRFQRTSSIPGDGHGFVSKLFRDGGALQDSPTLTYATFLKRTD